MKRIFYFICVAMMAASCLGDGPGTTQNYFLDADFEYGDAYFQADSVRFDNDYGIGLGYWDLGFYHKLTPDKSAVVGGFAVSRLKGSGYALGNNDFRVNSGKGYNGSATYAVFKYDKSAGNMPEHDMAFLNHQYGTCTMQEAYVNNTCAVVDYVKNNFVDGDRLVLKATGYLNGSQTGQAEMVLADYSEKKDSLVVNWAKFDLQKLGNVQFVEFELAGTKDDMPTSVCIDDVVAKIALQY